MSFDDLNEQYSVTDFKKSILTKWRSVVNNVDKNGEMALMYAIRNNNSQLVDILINAGADICHQNKNGEMAYQLLLNNSSLVNNISLSSLKRFLDNGVDVNRQNDEKNMLLHCLFFNMRPDMVSVIQLF